MKVMDNLNTGGELPCKSASDLWFALSLTCRRQEKKEERQKKLIVVQKSSLTVVTSLESEVTFCPIASFGKREHCAIILCSLIQIKKEQCIRWPNCSFILVSTVYSSLVEDPVSFNDTIVVISRDWSPGYSSGNRV